ncbi:MAG: hypothetical protein DRP09_20560 [Candidatus Thorarchaeota archaeon]|nr:MAG: hypothetical protein DRP09_20560 [Candidatus Thorarchaeota archaeon]
MSQNLGKYEIDNNRIVSKRTHEPIPDDEPVFILRARDRLAIQCLSTYISFCLNDNHRQGAIARALEFNDWKHYHPDLIVEPGEDT